MLVLLLDCSRCPHFVLLLRRVRSHFTESFIMVICIFFLLPGFDNRQFIVGVLLLVFPFVATSREFVQNNGFSAILHFELLLVLLLGGFGTR